ncbi:MAG: TldD/PmbA family protein [Candidatus Coatesbacteria bacterium]|nr:TldD/PmbA family protein [Candidatus Coatesbacteria bacterium]
MKNYKEIAGKIDKWLSRKKIDQSEVYIQENRLISVEILGNEIKNLSINNDSGLGIRAFRNKASGFVSQMGLDLKATEYIVKNLIDTIEYSDPDPDFHSLPLPSTSDFMNAEPDKKTLEISTAHLADIASKLIEEAIQVDKEMSLRGSIRISIKRNFIWNSLGILQEFDTVFCLSYLSATIKKGEDVGTYSDFIVGRKWSDLQFNNFGKDVSEIALKYLGARKIATGNYPVIASFDTASTFAESIATALNAEALQRKRSPFTGRLEEKLAVPFLTIIDNPNIPDAIRSHSYDGEGVPCKPVVLLENGCFKEILHNSYTAKKAETKSNGRGMRQSYGARPEITYTNIVVSPGDKTEAELIKQIDKGIYLTSAAFQPNSNGDISSAIDLGYWIENGELKYPIKNAMLGTTIFNLMKNLVAISSDGREFPGGIVYPSMMFENVMISGEKTD